MVVSSLSSIVFLIYRNSPRMGIFHSCDIRPRRLASLERMFLFSMLVLILTIITFTTIPITSQGASLIPFMPPISIVLLFGSILPLYVGLNGRKLIKKVKALDSTFPTFLKAFSDSMAVSGSMKPALKTVLLSDYGKLTGLIRPLLNRVKAGIQTEDSLRLFGAESGSKLIYTCSMILAECIRTGAKATVYGKILIDYVTSILIRRNKASQVSGSLKGIVIPLQLTLSAVLALIKSLTSMFGKFAVLVTPYIPFIQIPPTQLVEIYFFTILISVTLSNSLAIYFVEGESRFTFSFYLGLLMMLSAISFFFVYVSVDAFFSLVTRVEELGRLMEGT